MKILFATTEAVPYWKTGGLADVSRALPDALAARGHDVRIIHPLYASVRHLGLALESGGEADLPWPGGPVPVRYLEHRPDGRAPAILVDQPFFFEVDQPYEPTPNDPLAHGRRFGLFCRAILERARALDVDVVHLNDWGTGLVPAYALGGDLRAATVCAIHNLAYQGNFPPGILPLIGLPPELFRTENGLEFYGAASFLKAGIGLSDRVVTVSPTYAREIQTPEFGAGLDGLLRFRRRVLHGILNGIDPSTWDPTADPALAAPYGPDRLALKDQNRAAVLQELALEADGPFFVAITRLVHQKGIDLLLAALPRLLRLGGALAVLGSGDPGYERALSRAVAHDPRRITVYFGFNDDLARRLYAAGDFFLMPSLYEPCGLGQMIAQRYGTPPIVRRTGGLADTVQDGVTGISFDPATPAGLASALDRASKLWRGRRWNEMRRRCMRIDSSWNHSAAEYERVYAAALAALPAG